MNKLFHKGYFIEMFRQLRVAGIVAAAILMLSNVTSFFTIITGITDGYSAINYVMPGGAAMASSMMTYVYAASVVFTFMAFGWLNKRSTSDFYHGLPVTRMQMYGSTFLAVYLWLAIGLCAYAIVYSAMHLVFGAPFNYLLFLCVTINMFIGALQVVGAASIACAISGTRFVNLFATAVIVFIPRFMLVVLEYFIAVDGPSTLIVKTISPLFDPTYNIIATPYMSVIGLMSGNLYASVDYANAIAMLWSFVYSSLLVFLGGAAFIKRSSETAGIPSKSKLFQAFVRTAVGLPLLILLVFLIKQGIESAVVITVLIILSFVAYCLYELISTKSIKKMFKAMPLYLICVGISLLYFIVPGLIVKAELSVKVDSDNILGYRSYSEESYYGIFDDSLGVMSGSYAQLLSKDIEFNDAESLDIIVRAYERTMNSINSDNGMPSYYSGSYKNIVLHRKGRTITRRLLFTEAELTQLDALAYKNERYSQLMTEFPKGTTFFSCDNLSIKECREIGELFKEEYSTLSEADKLNLRSQQYYGGVYVTNENREMINLTMCVYGCYGARNYVNYYWINSLTPRTASRYIEILNKKHAEKGQQAISAVIKWMETGGNSDFSIGVNNSVSLYYWGMNYAMNDYNYSGKLPKDTDPEYYEILQILADASLTEDYSEGVLVSVSTSYYINKNTGELEQDYFDTFHKYVVKLSQSDYERIMTLYSQHEMRIWGDKYEDEPDYSIDF